MLVSRSADALEQVKATIDGDGGTAEVHPCDVGDGEAVEKLVNDIASEHGRLDVIVNNAGITRDGLILRMSDEDYDDVLRVNLRSAFVAARAASRHMMRGRFGRIVNIGSITGIMGNPGQANYAAAKAGLIGMTKCLAKELAAKGITANVVAPGYITSDMTERLGDAIKGEAAKQIPVRRFGEPEEIAHAVSYVTSDGAGYLNGHVLVVDGGLSC